HSTCAIAQQWHWPTAPRSLAGHSLTYRRCRVLAGMRNTTRELMPALSIDGPFRLSAELPRVLWALDAVAPAQQRKAVPSAILQAFNQHVDKRLAASWQRAEAAASLLRKDGSARMIVARIIDLFGHDAQLPKWGAGLRH